MQFEQDKKSKERPLTIIPLTAIKVFCRFRVPKEQFSIILFLKKNPNSFFIHGLNIGLLVKPNIDILIIPLQNFENYSLNT